MGLRPRDGTRPDPPPVRAGRTAVACQHGYRTRRGFRTRAVVCNLLGRAQGLAPGASMFNPANIQMGMTARDRDGEKVGTIIAADAAGFFIGRGRLFTRDCRMAFSDVADIDGEDVYLREELSHLPDLKPEALAPARRTSTTAGLPLQHDLTGGLGWAHDDTDEESPVPASARESSGMARQWASEEGDAAPRREAPPSDARRYTRH
ncbi:hypothetical protein BHS07_33330 [Myxococcus xanthus]|nr:hypothetical protein BHS07_33330 [Myxococcus xanthus]QDF00198.1 hypothetical protein BHS05_32620 [Myxococcus xanthus]QDF07965.1 hypothetical protein BHS04_32885 [Myxococcus xanthus]